MINRAHFVAIGNFNPAIFQPNWFSRHSIVPEEEIERLLSEPFRREIPEIKAIIEFGQYFLVEPNQALINFKSMSLRVSRDKLEAICEDRAKFPFMIEFLRKVFKMLPETPVAAYGINFNENAIFEKDIKEISQNLFSVNEDVSTLFGLDCTYGHSIKAKRGEITILFRVVQSDLDNNASLFAFNWQRVNSSPDSRFIVDKVGEDLEEGLKFAEEVMEKYCGKIITRISTAKKKGS